MAYTGRPPRILLLRPEEGREGLQAPNFEIEDRRRVARYELLEVLDPSRRRGAEYREDREYEPQARLKAVPSPEEVQAMIAAMAGKKDARADTYDEATGLILVLNV